jgi:PIN domain nuclease of toxin-antitoxin system
MSLNGFELLEIGFGAVMRTATLPWHHRDPFDRLLAAQALDEKLSLVSRDSVFDRYGIRRIW